ncbi:acyl-CoA dehydrogenase family protein [Mycobacteroides abscessus]|uniref:acyl-CoA dehydrogenase family protein n=1 Tax=Mycobacteroides abscessus TaxID=36809 RepID=UPI0009CE7444|nr:acyl-CoA dehydrogenase family protein [Mycobacteroides abscessus]SLG56655.1 acyl-CoA dehydrogenase FadE17_1 [Mycobacteroides abscessus subsp. abscessus]
MDAQTAWPTDPDAFRDELRAWLVQSYPSSLRTPMRPEDLPMGGTKGPVPSNPDTLLWMKRAASRGLTLPSAPREYGGAGLDGRRMSILAKEMRRIHARPPVMGGGPSLLAPVLLAYGTEDHKRRHLPPIARGELRWCQGFSEPEAGSDLASLRLRAVRDGDHYVLNGQKTWTSGATDSDWMFCLARTDPAAAKQQQGISMFLVDLATPGISIRPIRLINGNEEFCETYFDDVKVPTREMLGHENDGWRIAKDLLVHERSVVSEQGADAFPFPLLEAWRGLQVSSPEIDAAVVRNELNRCAVEATVARTMRLLRSGDVEGAMRLVNVVKVVFAEHTQQRAELYSLLNEWDGIAVSGEVASTLLDAARTWLYTRSLSIAGGSTEIQLNIISKRDLGLPVS